MGVFPASSGKFLPLSWRELMMRDVGCVCLSFSFPPSLSLSISGSLPSFPCIDILFPLTLYNIIMSLLPISLLPPSLPSSFFYLPPSLSFSLSIHRTLLSLISILPTSKLTSMVRSGRGRAWLYCRLSMSDASSKHSPQSTQTSPHMKVSS